MAKEPEKIISAIKKISAAIKKIISAIIFASQNNAQNTPFPAVAGPLNQVTFAQQTCPDISHHLDLYYHLIAPNTFFTIKFQYKRKKSATSLLLYKYKAVILQRKLHTFYTTPLSAQPFCAYIATQHPAINKSKTNKSYETLITKNMARLGLPSLRQCLRVG